MMSKIEKASFRVLVPLDDSELSARAVPWADRLGGALGAQIQLLTVLANGESGGPIEDEAWTRLETIRSGCRNHTSIEIDVVQGVPEEVISGRARPRSGEATMIVMSTRAQAGVERAVLGSTTAGVIRASEGPVLAINPDIAPPGHLSHHALVPLDGSDLSAAIIPALLPFARALGWTLHLVAVAPFSYPGVPVQGAVIPVPQPGIPEPEELRMQLDRVAAELRCVGIPAETLLAFGDRVEAILGHADSTACGFIAMSTHGRSGLTRLAIASLAEALINKAPMPVIAFHPQRAGPMRPVAEVES